MANFLRLLAGVALFPACWGVSLAFVRCIARAGGLGVEACSLLAGVVAFALCWAFLPHPVRTYVFGHEMTHAVWGLMFGARPSALKVGEKGGSVNLTKSNFLITLAPYFFPFYTFVVILAALAVSLFVRPLPWLPAWLFFVGFTWAFHVLFTLQTLTERQPDVTLYGRVFSWTFIYIANILVVVAALAASTDVGFAGAFSIVWASVCEAFAYTFDKLGGLGGLVRDMVNS